MNLEIFKKDMPTLCGGFPHQLPTLPYETPDMCFNQGETNPRRKALEFFFGPTGVVLRTLIAHALEHS